MLSKTEITDMSQLDQLAESASSIVIYGSKTPGRLVADYLISAGKAGSFRGLSIPTLPGIMITAIAKSLFARLRNFLKFPATGIH